MKIGIVGCSGRMGQTLLREVLSNQNCTLAGATSHKNELTGHDIAEIINTRDTGIKVTDSIEELCKNSDAIIEFTAPEGSIKVAEIVAKHGKVLVSGTTGFSDAEHNELKSFARDIAIVWSANMSIGVNVLLKLINQARHALNNDFDVEILEMHHRNKKDAPSGTALLMAGAINQTKDSSNYVFSRHGVGDAREKGKIGFASLRGGSVIGDHTVIFAGDSERIELTHRAEDRSIYAKGAIRAALWAKDKAPGFYSMQDVLSV
jgi:4-hydroxy-tetrahydrodipicolinate reductase